MTHLSRVSGAKASLHRSALLAFGRLPRRWRRLLVRSASPSYTVGAIGVIQRSDGSILLIRQVYRRNWGLPGGLLRRGEDPDRAVAREIAEEVGLDVHVSSPPAVVVDVAPQRVDLVYRLSVSEQVGEAAAPTSVEIDEARWFGVDDLPALQYETGVALGAVLGDGRSRVLHPDRPRPTGPDGRPLTG